MHRLPSRPVGTKKRSRREEDKGDEGATASSTTPLDDTHMAHGDANAGAGLFDVDAMAERGYDGLDRVERRQWMEPATLVEGTDDAMREDDMPSGSDTSDRHREGYASANRGNYSGGVSQRPVSRRNAPLDFNDDTKLHFPYKANFNDHFETSIEALEDLMPVLEAYRSLVRPNCPEKFTLYDPYYCAGAIRSHWKELGIEHFIHEKRDFYADISEGTVPIGFDMLVTNPPYSDDHIERLLDFLIGSNKAFAFLVPDYVASKDWYVKLIETCYTPNELTFRGQSAYTSATSGIAPQAAAGLKSKETMIKRPAMPPPMPPWLLPPSGPLAPATTSKQDNPNVACTPTPFTAGATTTVGVEPFYVVPRVRYDFRHPLGVGHDASHFKSMWFVWCGRRTNEVIRAASCEMAKKEQGPKIMAGLAELREAQVIRSEVRKNPKQRAKEGRSRGGRQQR